MFSEWPQNSLICSLETESVRQSQRLSTTSTSVEACWISHPLFPPSHLGWTGLAQTVVGPGTSLLCRESVPFLCFCPFPHPNLGAQFLHSPKRVRELVAASLSPLSEPGWQARRINALNLNISGMELLHYKLIVSYLNNIRILSSSPRAHSCNISVLLCRLLSEF